MPSEQFLPSNARASSNAQLTQ
ncbi:hypothetical protein XFF6166_630001 [Xanthomonas citri pv. fuscans]|nr:hypothetical protein XFF6166_630001 [Xanthomonas citri pv. fuscans]SOO07180.1 hypothetical protein XFF7767_920001 [Xanthomonas citri pv. fuscans]